MLAFGQFLALIDIQIVADSLNDLQTGLSAGPDEISWVQTAYLMAELVMTPFYAFLAQALSPGYCSRCRRGCSPWPACSAAWPGTSIP